MDDEQEHPPRRATQGSSSAARSDSAAWADTAALPDTAARPDSAEPSEAAARADTAARPDSAEPSEAAARADTAARAGAAEPSGDRPGTDSAEPSPFARPEGVSTGFADRPHPAPAPRHAPAPSPVDAQRYGRPAGAGSFDPPAEARVRPAHHRPSPVNPEFAASFGPSGHDRDGFEPPPGSRITPAPPGRHLDPAPELKMWGNRAQKDFWLGRGAVFTHGRPMQMHPAYDTLSADPLAGIDDIEPENPEPLELDDEQTDDAEETTGTSATRRRRPARLGLSTIGLMALVALIAGAVGGGLGYVFTHRADGLLHKGNINIAQAGTPANRPPGSVADIARRVGPAVVSIAVTTSSEYAVGSGVVIDKSGYVLTNNHVIAAATGSGQASIVVTFSNQSTADARVVGADPISDLAVLKVPTTELTVATLGNSDKLAVGDPVIAIGSPLGLQGTVTSGIVSALNRPVHVSNEQGGEQAYLDAIQVDAPINPGNSGGALVAADGTVVGINSAGATLGNGSGGVTPADGIGYAIPINYARDIAEQLIKTGKAVHGSLGVQGRTATDGTQRGAYLSQISPSGPAAAAGLKAGDVVVAVDGRVIQSYDELIVLAQERKPGDTLALTYLRDSDKSTTTVTLGSA